jgi:hypothetical protein
MLRVEFITTEDEADLIVSFAIAPAAERSLTLLRSPQYEHLLPEEERGITVDPFDPRELGMAATPLKRSSRARQPHRLTRPGCPPP